MIMSETSGVDYQHPSLPQTQPFFDSRKKVEHA